MLKKFEIEDFYMIGSSFEKYRQGLGSSTTMNLIWLFLCPLILFYELNQLNEIFYDIKPIAFLFLLVLCIISIFTAGFSFFVGKNSSAKYEMKNVKISIFSFYTLALLLIGFGFLDFLATNREIIFKRYTDSQVLIAGNLLLMLTLPTLIVSSVVLYQRIKRGMYRKNYKRISKLDNLALLTEMLTPIATSISFSVIMISNVGISNLLDTFMSLFCVVTGYLLIMKLPFLSMMYYLRKRFPENYLENYENKENMLEGKKNEG
ncbi:hypothetical protein I6N96_01790 [Enterococcus sp. BWM-S5]|uniref:Uncharacterized protein n=1 Tax=Enterococcus larvae TaxID=2794352 RepID=A0ABS4CGL5_9ENTE|nr:hypothetical protein [Enterococcus larvae]MBP1044994.1 hypothetical protein [Enterococcus larvae]